MSIDVEGQVRAALHEIADEARAAPFMQRLEHRTTPGRTSRPTLLALAASIVALVLAAASVYVFRTDDRSIVEPTVHPPKVLRLSGPDSTPPGLGGIVVVLTEVGTASTVFTDRKPTYVLPVAGGTPVLLAESDVDPTRTGHLSTDGTRVIREVTREGTPTSAQQRWFEIVDLRTGRIQRVTNGAGAASCPALSPDNRSIAANVEGGVVLLDAQGNATRTIENVANFCGALAWTPDSNRLVVRHLNGSLIVDRKGRPLSRIHGRYVVNGSMSWSPDGRRLLLYDEKSGRFVSRDVTTGSEDVLHRPAGATKPLGWAGSRIVWQAGGLGAQRLVVTDDQGRGARLWTRLETNGMPVKSISWSAALQGTAAD
jgi:Tol biopolymer transport system component